MNILYVLSILQYTLQVQDKLYLQIHVLLSRQTFCYNNSSHLRSILRTPPDDKGGAVRAISYA